MTVDQWIRMLAMSCLVISSLCLLGGEPPACLYEYYAPNTINYYHDLQGGISKDPEMLVGCAFISLIFSLPLMWAYHRGWYLLCCIFLLLIQSVILSMIEWGSVLDMISVNVVYCQNYWVLAWGVGQGLFWLLSLIFIAHETRE